MSAQQIIIVISVVMIVVIALAAARGSGPRIRQITRTVRKDKEDEKRAAFFPAVTQNLFQGPFWRPLRR